MGLEAHCNAGSAFTWGTFSWLQCCYYDSASSLAVHSAEAVLVSGRSDDSIGSLSDSLAPLECSLSE